MIFPPPLVSAKKWNTGSIFFRSGAKDIFYKIRQIMYDHEIREEKALTELTNKYRQIRTRVKRLNDTYNYVVILKSNHEKIARPIRVAHFHPHGYVARMTKNEEDARIIPDRLVKIFQNHKIS